jgi:hypothetical protein
MKVLAVWHELTPRNIALFRLELIIGARIGFADELQAAGIGFPGGIF